MIKFDRFILDNGLTVIVHQDPNTPIAAMNLIYRVGARDESPRRTGFAHLFEHLMFSGSENIPKFDIPLEKAGGENNAFTNSDYTNYYLTLPKNNLEIAMWLESDRMNKLAITENSLNIQKNVVIEEFKQNYLNQPYGDAYMLLKPMVYKKHPYRWITIGRNTDHIRNASLRYVRNFYRKYYNPNNAILSIAGNIQTIDIEKLAEKWFGNISRGQEITRNYTPEPIQCNSRRKTVYRNVTQNAIYMAFPMADRLSPEYYTSDLISDILSNGRSSRLYRRLVIDKGIFSDINAFISGDLDKGIFIIVAKLLDDIDIGYAEGLILKELEQLRAGEIKNSELKKVKNKAEAHLSFTRSSVLSKAMTLGYFEMLGDANMWNHEMDKYNSVDIDNIISLSNSMFAKNNRNTLIYRKAK